MKKIVAYCEVFLDKRRIKKDNTFPVKLKITFNRERKYYNTNVNISEYEWNSIHQKRTPNTLLRIKQKFKELEVSAQNCIDKIDKFTFVNFEKAYFPKRPDKHNVECAYREYIQELNEQERFGSANLYECSISALLKYKSNLRFEDVTPLFLEKFENYIINKGLSITTVGIYIRPLRAIINREIRNENYSLNDYPFTNENSYIFPLLNNSLSPFQTKEKTRIVSHSINAQMRKIAQKIGFNGDITTYSARHSYAIILLNLGAPVKLVSDNLGHSTVSVTENYLAGFTVDFIIDYTNKMDNSLHLVLISFTKINQYDSLIKKDLNK